MSKNKCYLLDTNILIELIRGNKNVIDHIIREGLDSCYMSVVSLYELYYGAYKARTYKEEYFEQEMTRIGMLRQRFKVIPLSEEADNYAKTKLSLWKAGTPIDEYDIIIGSQALTYNLTVVTDNVKHFERMHNVNVVNWALQQDETKQKP